MTVDITASIMTSRGEIHASARHEIDGQGLPFTWLRIMNQDRSLLLIEDWPPGHLDEPGVVRRARWLVEAGSAEAPAAHLVGMDAISITHRGRPLLVRSILGMDVDSQPFTVITVADAVSGEVLASDSRGGWLTVADIGMALEFLLYAEQPKPLATDDHRWVTVTLESDGWVTSEFTEGSESGLVEVWYDDDDEVRVRQVHVKARCSEWQNERIAEMLRAHSHFAKQHGGHFVGFVGRERVCHHDPAFEPVHDGNCCLLAWDALAGALQTEVQAMLAEPQPADGLPC